MKWYLVYVKPGCEKKVSDVLTRKKIEHYSPESNVLGRVVAGKHLLKPSLFKGYIFIRTIESFLTEIKKVSGVANLVYWLGRPASVKDVEIKAIRLFLHEYTDVTIEKVSIKPEYVSVAAVAEVEQEAPMITIRNKRAFIGLPSLGYIMSAEIETANVRIISSDAIRSTDNLRSNKLINRVSEFNNSLKNYWIKVFIVSISIAVALS